MTKCGLYSQQSSKKLELVGLQNKLRELLDLVRTVLIAAARRDRPRTRCFLLQSSPLHHDGAMTAGDVNVLALLRSIVCNASATIAVDVRVCHGTGLDRVCWVCDYNSL